MELTPCPRLQLLRLQPLQRLLRLRLCVRLHLHLHPCRHQGRRPYLLCLQGVYLVVLLRVM